MIEMFSDIKIQKAKSHYCNWDHVSSRAEVKLHPYTIKQHYEVVVLERLIQSIHEETVVYNPSDPTLTPPFDSDSIETNYKSLFGGPATTSIDVQ